MLPVDWNSGGLHQVDGAGSPSLRDLLNPLVGGLSLAELKAVSSPSRVAGSSALIGSARYTFNATSALTGDDQLVIAPTVGSGRYLAAPGQTLDLEFAFTFATADAAVLYTMPAGSALLVHRGYWEVTTPFTGGTSSAIGASSSQAPHTTKGDLHGGSGGDVEATLVAGDYIEGTAAMSAPTGVILRAGSTIRFDRITSVFTAGVGKLHIVGTLLANAGA